VTHTIAIEPIQGTFQPSPVLAARLKERAAAIPGVQIVAQAMRKPLRGSPLMAQVSGIAGSSRVLDAGYNEVTPEFFSALEIPITLGRAFAAEETDAVVVSESTAKRFWPGEYPTGKSFEITTSQYTSGGREALLTTSRTVRVTGVAKDVVSSWLSDGVDPTCIYLPGNSGNAAYYSLILRVYGDPRALLPLLRAKLGAVDASIEFDMRTMADVMDLQILPFRLASWGAATLGLLGLTLASIGIYGVMAYTVSQRTREIGIRMALGADRRQILWMNLREGLRLIGIAAGGGLAVALALSHVMRAMLFRIDASDPATFAIAPAVLTVVGLVAIYFPSRRATRVDPHEALRSE
jgi:predicted permease